MSLVDCALAHMRAEDAWEDFPRGLRLTTETVAAGVCSVGSAVKLAHGSVRSFIIGVDALPAGTVAGTVAGAVAAGGAGRQWHRLCRLRLRHADRRRVRGRRARLQFRGAKWRQRHVGAALRHGERAAAAAGAGGGVCEGPVWFRE